MSRRGAVAACLANTIEWYDFAVYGSMAAVLVHVLMPPESGARGLVAVFAVFATSFLTRPVGALLVGLRADRAGRRAALSAMVLLMTAATVAIGLLPPWSAVGWLAPACLLALRLVQGFSSGGEVTASITFLVESVPRRRWGMYGGWHTATMALGIAGGIAVASLVAGVLTEDRLQAWGWRVPFLLALPLGVVWVLLRRRIAESPEFAALAEPGTAPAGRAAAGSVGLVWRRHGPGVRTGFVLVGVLTATFNLWFVFLPAHLVDEDLVDLSTALSCSAAGLVAAAVSAPLLGLLSDRVGRRPLLAAGNAMLGLLVVPLYLAAVHGPPVALVVGDVLVGLALGSLVVSSHLAEQFPAAVRATGIAMSFGLATALVGGTAPLVGSVLAAAGHPLGIPVYLALLTLAGLFAALRAPSSLAVGPETVKPESVTAGPGTPRPAYPDRVMPS